MTCGCKPLQVATVYHKTVSQENVKNPDLEYMQKLRIWGISCDGIPQKRESDIRQENDGHLKQICPIGNCELPGENRWPLCGGEVTSHKSYL